jgi:hypothetical protein
MAYSKHECCGEGDQSATGQDRKQQDANPMRRAGSRCHKDDHKVREDGREGIEPNAPPSIGDGIGRGTWIKSPPLYRLVGLPPNDRTGDRNRNLDEPETIV